MEKHNTADKTEYEARLRAAHRQLGIPDSYLDNSRLPLCVEPGELIATEPDYYQRPQRLTPAAHSAWTAMRQAAARHGVVLHLISAFRGIDYQCELIRKKLEKGQRMEDILTVVAAPGFSEHHTGRAIDLGTVDCPALEVEFENTSAFQWLAAHAKDFGFVMSYPRDNPLGISYEPWHWCFQSHSSSYENSEVL